MKFQIGYLTEDPEKQYGKSIRQATTKKELIAAVSFYGEVTEDALKQAEKMSDIDFEDFRKDLIKAAREQPDEWIEKFNDRFGCIAMPMKMIIASILANQFKAPWGTAYIRATEIGWDKVCN